MNSFFNGGYTRVFAAMMGLLAVWCLIVIFTSAEPKPEPQPEAIPFVHDQYQDVLPDGSPVELD